MLSPVLVRHQGFKALFLFSKGLNELERALPRNERLETLPRIRSARGRKIPGLSESISQLPGIQEDM